MARSTILRSAFGAAMLAAMACSSPALALEAKQCLPMAEMNTALKAEGQRTMIIGDRIAAVGKAGLTAPSTMIRAVNTVTSNEDGSLGYQLEGNRSRSEASTQVCVRAKLTDIQLFDARKAAIPKAAYLGGDFDRTVNVGAEGGSRPMLLANTLFGSGATLRRGLPLMVFGNIPERAGSIATRLPNGKAEALALMNQVEYTSVALERLGNRQLASLSLGGGN